MSDPQEDTAIPTEDISPAPTSDAPKDADLQPVGDKLQSDYQEPAAQGAAPTSTPQQLKLSDLLSGKQPPAAATQTGGPQKLSDLLSNEHGDEPGLFNTGKELSPAERLWVQNQTFYKVGQMFGNAYHAMGQAASEEISSNLRLDPDTIASIKSAGIWKGVNASEDVAHQSFMDGTLIPALQRLYNGYAQPAVTSAAATVAGATNLAFSTVVKAPFEGYLAAVDTLPGVEVPKALTGGVELPPVTPGGVIHGLMEMGPEGFGEGALHGVADTIPTPILRFKAAGVMDGEAAYFGSATEAQSKAMNDAAQSIPREIVPATEHQNINLNVAVRQANPELFKGYDGLTTQRESLMAQYKAEREARDLGVKGATSPFRAEIEDMQRELDKPTPPKKAASYPEKIADLKVKEQEWLEQQGTALSPKMEEIRDKLQDVNNQIHDIVRSGKISEAYRNAEATAPVIGKPSEKAAGEPPAAQSEPMTVKGYVDDYLAGKGRDSAEHEQFAANNAAAIEKEFQDRLGADKKPVEDQLQSIRDDVKRESMAAGSSEELATQHAELLAQHYKALVEEGSVKGSIEDAYNNLKANVRAGKERAKVLAQNQDGKTLAQKAKGKITLGVNGLKNIITLFKSADESTFIHETGHHWLDEMARIAETEDATPAFKKRMEAVNEWLGVKDGEEVTTKQHEKFARGFERYMMEGVAPSRELETTFSKFKDWLTKIYQTVDRLKSPINDNIRSVFDHLLSANPQKAVIAPDMEHGEAMANVHEADVATVPPEKADAAADHIEEEIDKTIDQHKPEIKDEIKSTGETGSQPAAPTGNPETPAAAEPVAAGSGAPQEPGAQPVGSGATEAQGTTGAAPAGRGGAEPEAPSGGSGGSITSNAEDKSGKPGASDTGDTTTRPAESDLVDKAGNIRLDNLNTTDDVNEVLRQVAGENDNFLKARRGVISKDQQMQLADELGMDASKLDMRKIGQAFNAEEILAARKLLIQSATEVKNLASIAAKGSDEDIMKYVESVSRHQMIQGHVSGLTAEAGRALGAFRKLEGAEEAQAIGDFLKDTTGKDLFQLQQEAKLLSSLGSTQKVSKFIRDGGKPSFGDQILEYWINGLISGPATHGTYSIGNTILTLWRSVPEAGVAALLSKARGGEIQLGEVGARLKAMKDSLPAALSSAGTALKSGVTTRLPGEAPWTLPFQTATDQNVAGEEISNMNMKWKEVGAQSFGAIKGMRDAFLATGELLKSGGLDGAPLVGLKRSPLGAIPDVTIKGINLLPVGTLARIPGRSIAAIHSFFRTVNYSVEKSALAYRQASKENLNDHDFAARVNQLVTDPTEEMMDKSRFQATEATLMGRGGKFTQALSTLTNSAVDIPGLGQTKLLKFIDPFVHISSNILDQSILQRTPIGLFSKEVRDNLMGRNGAEARDFAQARMLVGTALAVTAGGMAAEGMASGSGPSNPKERAIWIAAGNQPHSIKVGDMWYDIHRLGPIGQVFSIGADLHDVAQVAEKGDMAATATSLVHAISQNVLDESFMRGPSELIMAASDSERYGPSYVRNFASSFLPYSVGMSQMTRATDPYMRQTRTLTDAIMAKIPGQSEKLMPRRNVWGEPMESRSVLGVPGLSAIYETKVNNDPVDKALLSLGFYPSTASRKIRGVQLDEKQYDDYAKLSGQLMKQRLDGVVNQNGFENLPDGKKFEVMNKIIHTARENARTAILAQYPDIMQKAVEQKHRLLETGKK